MTCFVYEANQSSSILLYKISINLIVIQSFWSFKCWLCRFNALHKHVMYFFPDPILILGIWSVVFFCCFNRTCIWDVLAGCKLDVSKLAVCTFSADGGQKLCCKKPGANWRLGGNFVGCSNRPVNMVKAKRRGKRVGGTVKMHPNPRDDWSGRNHKWDFCGPSCWDVFFVEGGSTTTGVSWQSGQEVVPYTHAKQGFSSWLKIHGF